MDHKERKVDDLFIYLSIVTSLVHCYEIAMLCLVWDKSIPYTLRFSYDRVCENMLSIV